MTPRRIWPGYPARADTGIACRPRPSGNIPHGAGTDARFHFGDSDADYCRYGNGADQAAGKDVPGATGWFTANDTGGAINGRHVDVYRAPPDAVDDPGRNLVKQRIYVVPPGQAPGAGAPPGR